MEDNIIGRIFFRLLASIGIESFNFTDKSLQNCKIDTKKIINLILPNNIGFQ